MPRSISVVRRRTGLVDLTVRQRPGKIGFRFGAAANFDVAFTTFQVVPNHGFKTPDIPDSDAVGAIGSQFRDQVRFLFNPGFYTASVAAVRDDKPWFIRLEAQNPDGTFDAPEAMHMIMPFGSTPLRAVQLSGTVPSGADLTASLEIQLPMLCDDFEIQNDGAADMYVAFERGAVVGPEYRVPPLSAQFMNLSKTLTNVSQVFMRGNGGTTTISAIFTAKNNPIGL